MKNNIIYDKSFAFSIRVVRLVQFLQGEKKRIYNVKAGLEKRHKYRRESCGSKKRTE